MTIGEGVWKKRRKDERLSKLRFRIAQSSILQVKRKSIESIGFFKHITGQIYLN